MGSLYNEKELARLIKEAAKTRIVWQKVVGGEMVTNGHWAVFSEKFEDMKIRVALYAAFGREIKNGECLAMIAGEFFPHQQDIIHAYQPGDSEDIGILTPFMIGFSPDQPCEVQICNFGETTADLYGIDLNYIGLTESRSCFRNLDNEGSPLYFGDAKQVMIYPVKAKWDEIIQKYAGLYRNKSDYIQAMIANDEKSNAVTEIDEAIYQEAKLLIMREQTASVSLLQRKMRMGYAMASRMIDRMEQEGIVSAYSGNSPRKVLVTE